MTELLYNSIMVYVMAGCMVAMVLTLAYCMWREQNG